MTTTEPSSPANPDEYNGWTNRETWAAHLWLSNDEPIYLEVRQRIRDGIDAGKLRWAQLGVDLGPPVTTYAADAVKEFVDEILDPDEEYDEDFRLNMASDIGSLWRVNWREIAAALAEDQ